MSGNARLANLEADLNMTGYDYNIILSVFYISYIIFEIPSNLCCKWLGPGWFLPGICLAFGLVSVFTAFVQTMPQMCGVRLLLGVFEAGVMPGIAYYMSRWYRRAELAFRLSVYIVMTPLAGAFGGLLASGILSLESFGAVKGWRMIFAIEGIITVGLSLMAFATMTDRPETARWLSEAEKDLATTRVKSERVGATRVLDKMDTKKIWLGVMSPVTLGTALTFLCSNITVQGLAFFLPSIVKTIYPSETVIKQQLYTVPPYIVGGFFTLFFPYCSWRLDNRQIFQVLSAPGTMIGYIMFLASEDAKVRYAATFLIASAIFVSGPMSNAQVSANLASDTARSAGIAMNVMIGNMGGLISTWTFLPNDGPNYPIGNGVNLATSSLLLLSAVFLLFWMKWDNNRRAGRNVEEELRGMSAQEIEDLDWKHPEFRWNP